MDWNNLKGSSQKDVLNRSNIKPFSSVDKMFTKQLNRSIFIKTVLLSLPIVHYIFHNSHTVLISFSYRSHTVLIPFSYRSHTVLIRLKTVLH